MKKIAILVLAITITPMVSFAEKAIMPKWETDSCIYNDLSKDIVLFGRCHIEHTEIHGNFATVLTWPSGNKVTVEYTKSQSGHHLWQINGVSGVGFEINRMHLNGFTLDMNQFIEWESK